MTFSRPVILIVLLCALNTPLLATTPPRGGGPMPDAFLRVQQQKPRAFTYKRALMPWLSTILRNRAALQNSGAAGILGNIAALEATTAQGSPSIAGTKSIPVLLLRFSNTVGDEGGHPLFASSVLQRKLFDGDPTRPGASTIGDFYREMSYGLFTVRGTVYDWKSLSKPDTFYEGQDYQTPQGIKHCNGLCDTAKLPDLIKEAVDANPDIDWAQYDNDGPDGIPNSGDDDGYVDFVAFAHAEHGAECDSGNNIWSHRFSLSGWTGAEYVTKSKSVTGGFIKIDDYTIQPAYGCDGTTPNEIGVFAHEFGHAFGLPDLYDTSGRGEGLGNWCLMAGGAWGGDGQSPDQPVQMSAWAKELLGWVTPKDVNGDTLASIATIEDHADVYRLTISPTQYYLIDNLGKKLSNSKLPTAGVQIFQINQAVVNAGLRSNKVNFNPDNYGVDLIEADGLRRLHHANFRGDAADLFPGSTGNTRFDGTTNPRNLVSAICQIMGPGDVARMHFFPSNMCAPSPAPPQLPVSQNDAANITTAPQSLTTGAKVSDILSNPTQYLSGTVQVVGRLENKGANIQLRKGRDFWLTDSSGSIPVRLALPLEIGSPRESSDKMVASDVLDETVRVLAVVEMDSITGRPRLLIKNTVIVKQ